MRTGAAAHHRGYYHETVFYGSDEEFLAVVMPFLTGGVEAGEPTLAAVSEANEQLIRAEIGDSSEISFLGERAYDRPASVIASFREVLTAYVADGAEQIRVVGEVPHPGRGQPWDEWARYEAAANHVFADFPLWGLCPYDTRIAAPDVLADAARTHPYVASADGQHLANDRFEDPAAFLTGRPPASGDVLEASAPTIELVDPTLFATRQAVREACRDVRLDPAEVDDLLIAVSETVTNAMMHSRPPVRVRVWTALDRVVVTVTDPGHGPGDPFAGLIPAHSPAGGGCGLWIVHQLSSHVTMSRGGNGFTIRLVAGSPSVSVPVQATGHDGDHLMTANGHGQTPLDKPTRQ